MWSVLKNWEHKKHFIMKGTLMKNVYFFREIKSLKNIKNCLTAMNLHNISPFLKTSENGINNVHVPLQDIV